MKKSNYQCVWNFFLPFLIAIVCIGMALFIQFYEDAIVDQSQITSIIAGIVYIASCVFALLGIVWFFINCIIFRVTGDLERFS